MLETYANLVPGDAVSLKVLFQAQFFFCHTLMFLIQKRKSRAHVFRRALNSFD